MFLYKLTLGESYYSLYGALWYGICCGYIISAESPEEARKMANAHHGGAERTVSLAGFGNLDYGDRTNIWINEKFTEITRIGTSEIDRGVVMVDFKDG